MEHVGTLTKTCYLQGSADKHEWGTESCPKTGAQGSAEGDQPEVAMHSMKREARHRTDGMHIDSWLGNNQGSTHERTKFKKTSHGQKTEIGQTGILSKGAMGAGKAFQLAKSRQPGSDRARRFALTQRQGEGTKKTAR